ncbi:HIT domain-containing protein [Sneathiella sp.]|jgi:diadenosine tetraphosphate (Ap4A) HIT family hydrolase|uniref:HIT domain-containing protein n=1 Tax=Sneathiella sp. TaxID=1964365 RepID=UPI0039E21913
MFKLHPRLQADTTHIQTLEVCGLYLMNDARYPWLILVPHINDVREMHHLPSANYSALCNEIRQISTLLETCFKPEKLNIGALGNIVPQLHIHIIGRHAKDPAWPGPVWGVGEGLSYDPQEKEDRIALIKKHL